MTAATRKTPTQANGGSDDGISYTNAVDAEIEALWKGASIGWLINIAGTPNAVTATSDTAVVAAITSYARPMAFWYAPPASFGNNTAAVTFNIDGVGIISCKDQFGAALQGGEFNGGTSPGVYPLVYDGTNLRAVTVTAGAANRPVTQPDILIQEQQASGTNGHGGATFTSGAYRQRFLNTIVRNNIGATLATNQITLPAGTYFAQWSCPALTVGLHKTRLFNATDSTVLALGTAETAGASINAQTRSVGSAIFTLTSSKAIEIDHRCASTEPTNGFGSACSFGDTEIYSEIRILEQ